VELQFCGEGQPWQKKRLVHHFFTSFVLFLEVRQIE
jgi:hypothetical protein